MTRLIVFIILLVHGIGHLQGVFISLGIRDFGNWNANSWMLKSWFSADAQRVICLIIFLLTTLLTLAGVISYKGLWLPEVWWKQLLLGSAILSTVAIVFYPNAFAMFFNKLGAAAVNLIIFYTLFISSEWLENIS